jgi:hypothetical protein
MDMVRAIGLHIIGESGDPITSPDEV